MSCLYDIYLPLHSCETCARFCLICFKTLLLLQFFFITVCLFEQQVWWHKSGSWKERIHRPHSGNCPLDGMGALQSNIHEWLFRSYVWACCWVNTERASLCGSPGTFHLTCSLSAPAVIEVHIPVVPWKEEYWCWILWEIKCLHADMYIIKTAEEIKEYREKKMKPSQVYLK